MAGVVVAIQPMGSAGLGRATGQLTAGLIADRVGILGLEQAPISPERVVGVVLLRAGTYLVVR